MITQKDLKNLIYLRQEIKHIEQKIANYKPAEIVMDSVRGSSPFFPFVEHTITIQGLEQKRDSLSNYFDSLHDYKEKLEKEEKRIEEEIQKIPSSEIKQIIRLHYIEQKSYIEIMHIMSYNAPETPRIKLMRYLEEERVD